MYVCKCMNMLMSSCCLFLSKVRLRSCYPNLDVEKLGGGSFALGAARLGHKEGAAGPARGAVAGDPADHFTLVVI